MDLIFVFKFAVLEPMLNCSAPYAGDNMRLRSRVGTPVYMAPEVFQRNFGKESDMWSLGVLLFQLISGTFPFW